MYRQTVTHPGINPVQQDLTSLGQPATLSLCHEIEVTVFGPQQDGIQTLKSHGITTDTRRLIKLECSNAINSPDTVHYEHWACMQF